MRLVIARCSVDYAGRLNAHLPLATRLLGSVPLALVARSTRPVLVVTRP